jgi:hypothetical protein
MRLFLPIRKHLMPDQTRLVATDPDMGPSFGGEMLTTVPSVQTPNRASYIIAGVVILGIALIAVGPRHSSEQADQQQLRQQAENGNPKAQLQLALDYRDGRLGLPVDLHSSAVWLNKSAQAGNPYAEALLGDAYSQGDGVPRDPAAAQRWWRLAAQSSDTNGALPRLSGLLDDLTENGQAIDQLKSRALAGDNVAQYQLAMHYRDGAWGVDADLKLALSWLRLSANRGNPVAMTTLADAYADGHLGLTPDPDQARAWRQRAAQTNPL